MANFIIYSYYDKFSNEQYLIQFRYQINIIMGSQLCGGPQLHQHLIVEKLPDQIPKDKSYMLFRGKSHRYSDLSVISNDNNTYIFTLKLQDNNVLTVTLPVLNQIAHRATYANYKLQISKNLLIDPMDPSYNNTLIAVKNDMSGIQYSLRVIPFTGYNSQAFKKGLEEVWIHQKKITIKDRHLFLHMEDAFIYGINPDRQALVILFEKADATLFHMGQYRREANWPWTPSQQTKIISNLMQSCNKLQQLGIIHRDIRPPNIYYMHKLNRYVLGNFSTARQITDQIDLLTVCGVQALSSKRQQQLIIQKTDMGLFDIKDKIYSSIELIVKYLHTLTLTNITNQIQNNPMMMKIMQSLNERKDLQIISNQITRTQKDTNKVDFSEDRMIYKTVEKLVYDKYRQTVEQYQFKTYQFLGYYKQLSEMAHRIIEKNHVNEEPFKNAYIFKDLGNFYERNGTGGSQYLLNSCILFCKQAEKLIQYKLYNQAGECISQAQQIYVKISTLNDFPLNLIEINRLRALLKVYKFEQDEIAEKKEAISLINKTLSKAGEKNLTIEKQMKLFLTWGVIYREANNLDQSEERFNNGLSICANSAAFQSPSSSLLLKSSFLYQLGLLIFMRITAMHDPQKPFIEQQYNKLGYHTKLESSLTQSLEIRERQSTNLFHIIQCHEALGSFYLLINNYSQTKNHNTKALMKLKQMKQEVSPSIEVSLNYNLGSACYKLKQYRDAQVYYSEAIRILQVTQFDEYWKHCIKGNLALTKIIFGELSGDHQLQQEKQIIRIKMGPSHYDYLFLVSQQNKIRKRS